MFIALFTISVFFFAIWQSFHNFNRAKKLQKEIEDLKRNSVSKSEVTKLIEENKKLSNDLIWEKNKTYNGYRPQEKSTDLVTVQVDKSIAPRKVKPSEMSPKELEDCINYYLDHYLKKTK
jgi:hypothetical protein